MNLCDALGLCASMAGLVLLNGYLVAKYWWDTTDFYPKLA